MQWRIQVHRPLLSWFPVKMHRNMTILRALMLVLAFISARKFLPTSFDNCRCLLAYVLYIYILIDIQMQVRRYVFIQTHCRA